VALQLKLVLINLTECDSIWNISVTGNVCLNVTTEQKVLMGLHSKNAKCALMFNEK